MSQSEKKPSTNTSPPDGKTHEATTPPGSGDTDQQAVRIAQENIEKAGAGH
ncbi:MAG: hypothetical protein NVS1B9_10460 [Solirubrobacteraceae bacterium]